MNCYRFYSQEQFLTLAAAEGLIAINEYSNKMPHYPEKTFFVDSFIDIPKNLL
jgi:hypothetical protein